MVWVIQYSRLSTANHGQASWHQVIDNGVVLQYSNEAAAREQRTKLSRRYNGMLFRVRELKEEAGCPSK